MKVNREEKTVPLGKVSCHTNSNIKDVVDIHDTIKRLEEEGATKASIEYVRSY